MSVFDIALGHIAADPNLGVDAAFRVGGAGASTVLRVLRSSPDRTVDVFSTGIVQATDVLTVPIAVLAAVDAGDTFTIAGQILTVTMAERDAGQVAWRVLCRR